VPLCAPAAPAGTPTRNGSQIRPGTPPAVKTGDKAAAPKTANVAANSSDAV
jgi:hypothetical protein